MTHSRHRQLGAGRTSSSKREITLLQLALTQCGLPPFASVWLPLRQVPRHGLFGIVMVSPAWRQLPSWSRAFCRCSWRWHSADFRRLPRRDLSSTKCLGAVGLRLIVGIVAASLACAGIRHGVTHDATVAGVSSARVPSFASTWPLHRQLPQRGHLGLLSRHCWLGARQMPWSGRLCHYSWRGRSLGFHRLLRRGLSLADWLSAASPARWAGLTFTLLYFFL